MISSTTSFRLVMALFGALGGLSAWALIFKLPELTDNTRLILFLSVATGSGFFCLGVLSGPVRPLRVILPAILLGGGLGALIFWASYRHSDVGDFLSLVYPIAACAVTLLIAVPFIGAACLGRWRDYPTLFELTWTAFVRVLVALVFTGLFWSLAFLSNALLEIVKITIIEDLLDYEPVPFLLTGVVFGLALAVVHELRAYISPFLVLRLFRLLVPVVLVVVAIFVVAVPFNGLSGLINGLSPTVTLLSFALAAVVFITTSIDQNDAEAIAVPWLRASVQTLACFVPVLAGLAIYAVWQRIHQYGLTPERIWAMTVAIVTFVYGLAYVVAILRGSGWMARMRRANIVIALTVLAIGLLWLTPLMTPEAWSARSQLKRIATLETPDRSALYNLAQVWGKPGQAALAEVEKIKPDWADLIAEAQKARNLYSFAGAYTEGEEVHVRQTIFDALHVIPKGALAGPDALKNMNGSKLKLLEKKCLRTLNDMPGCILLITGPQQDMALFFEQTSGNRVSVETYEWDGEVLGKETHFKVVGATGTFSLPVSVLEDVMNGNATWGPVARPGLSVGDVVFFPDN